MKRIVLIAALLLLTGCSTISAVLSQPPICPGTRYYDPQVCRGEKFDIFPNFENDAIIRYRRGEKW